MAMWRLMCTLNAARCVSKDHTLIFQELPVHSLLGSKAITRDHCRVLAYHAQLAAIQHCHPTNTGCINKQMRNMIFIVLAIHCRLCVAVPQSPLWAAAAVKALQASLRRLQRAMAGHEGPWLNQ